MLGLRVRGRGGWDRTAAVAAPKSAFLWGSTPFLCARAKKWGGIGSRGDRLLPKETAHTQPRANEVLPCLCFVRVRRYVGWGSMACPAFRPHFFGACPKKRCRAAKEKRLFYLGGSTIRVSATASVVFTHLRPTWGGGWWLSGVSGRKKAGGKDRRLPRRCRGDPIITCTSPAGGSPLLCFHASNFQHPARGGSREACNSRRNVASLISNVGLKGP